MRLKCTSVFFARLLHIIELNSPRCFIVLKVVAMMTKIALFVSLFTLSTITFDRANASQVADLDVALHGLRSAVQLPTLEATPNTELVLSNEPLPDQVKGVFSEIQKFVYGNDNLIALKACDGCQAIANANTMSVYLDPQFLNALKTKFGADSKNIIAFVVAHEISHFTYEYITLSSANKLSPSGNIPLLTKYFINFVDLAKFTKLTPQEQQVETLKYLKMAARAHSEVDLLGLLTLKGMGLQVSAEAIKYLQEEVLSRSPEEQAQTDFKLRLKNVSDAVANGEL
jgi:hypothetical protein